LLFLSLLIFHFINKDLKPENLLIGMDGTLKIADFGLARNYGSPNAMTNEVASLWYRAPELLFGARYYSSAIDIWSAGCIFGEMILRCPLFAALPPEKGEVTITMQLAKIFSILGTPKVSNWPDMQILPKYIQFEEREALDLREILPTSSQSNTEALYELLIQLIQYNPNQRPTANIVLQHRYFTVSPLACDPVDLPVFTSLPNADQQQQPQKQSRGQSQSIVVSTSSSSQPVVNTTNANTNTTNKSGLLQKRKLEESAS
jgi:cyclin-dependent kinase 7